MNSREQLSRKQKTRLLTLHFAVCYCLACFFFSKKRKKGARGGRRGNYCPSNIRNYVIGGRILLEIISDDQIPLNKDKSLLLIENVLQGAAHKNH